MTDLSHYVLAEDVKVGPYGERGAIIETTFTFLCPNCARRHHGRELSIRRYASFSSYRLKCGWAKVRMPWADGTPPDERDVYG
jgi:hypothetical protein